jgi:hypothetical protein
MPESPATRATKTVELRGLSKSEGVLTGKGAVTVVDRSTIQTEKLL